MHTHFPRHWKLRLLYGAATLAVIVLGLASRKIPALFPTVLGQYPGDALWALMLFFAFCTITPDAKPHRLFLTTILVSYSVEFSQLYQATWIQNIRATTLGHLVLGSGFNPIDLIAYTVGAGLGAILKCFIPRIKGV